MPLQKELVVNTTTDEDPKTPALTDQDDSLLPLQTYKTCQIFEHRRHIAGQRPLPLTIKATMSAEWLKSYLASDCYKKTDSMKRSFEEIDDEELFRVYMPGMSRRKKNDPKTPSNFRREHQNFVSCVSTACAHSPRGLCHSLLGET